MTAVRRVSVAALLALACALLLVPGASAYWTNGGFGNGSALTETMPGGITPTVSAVGTTVTVDISQVSVNGQFIGALGGGYIIKRYPAAGGASVTPGGTCGVTVTGGAATLSCTESSAPRGDWRYTVSPTLFQWTSAESATSATLVIAPDAATGLAVTRAPAAAMSLTWTAGAGATGYNVYRRTTAGAYNFATPLNGATPVSGTTYNDTTATNGTSYNYVVRSVVIGSAGQQIASGNSNETAALTADGTLPTGVTLGAVPALLVGVATFTGTASDTISGVASLIVEYRTSPSGAWTQACSATTAPYSCTFNTTLAADGLYDFRARAVDGAGNTTSSAIQTNRVIDNNAPTVTLTNPGSPLRATVALAATATDAGSGMASVAFQYTLTGGATWTTISTDAATPYAASFNTVGLNGIYDIRALATDVAGNQSMSTVTGIVLDNTVPTAINIGTANGGATAGRPDSGDTITYTYSEPMLATSILAGWTGASTPVTVRLTNAGTDTMTVRNAGNTAQLPLGSVRIGRRWVTATATFSATMTMSGNSVIVTLGTQTGGTVGTSTTSYRMRWTPSATATDLAGNAMTATNFNEPGANDYEF